MNESSLEIEDPNDLLNIDEDLLLSEMADLENNNRRTFKNMQDHQLVFEKNIQKEMVSTINQLKSTLYGNLQESRKTISKKKTMRATMKMEKKKLLEEEKACGDCKLRDDLIAEMEKMMDELNATNLKHLEEIKKLK